MKETITDIGLANLLAIRCFDVAEKVYKIAGSCPPSFAIVKHSILNYGIIDVCEHDPKQSFASSFVLWQLAKGATCGVVFATCVSNTNPDNSLIYVRSETKSAHSESVVKASDGRVHFSDWQPGHAIFGPEEIPVIFPDKYRPRILVRRLSLGYQSPQARRVCQDVLGETFCV